MNNIYQNNPNLKSSNVPIEFTPEQVEEYIKCANDPIYFLEHYAKIITLDDGPVLFNLYEYQKRLIEKIHNENNVLGLLPRQQGKCTFGATNIKTRNKKTGEILITTMGDLYERLNKEKSAKNDIK